MSSLSTKLAFIMSGLAWGTAVPLHAEPVDLDVSVTISDSRKFLEFWIENHEDAIVECDYIKQKAAYVDATTGAALGYRIVSIRDISILPGQLFSETEGGKDIIKAWEAANRFANISDVVGMSEAKCSANWRRDAQSDSNSDGRCDEGEACVYQDLRTNRYWTKNHGLWAHDYVEGFCENLSYGGFSDWRIPTKEEVFTASDNGLARNKLDSSNQPIFDLSVWTSSRDHNNRPYSVSISSKSAGTSSYFDSPSFTVCVR